MTRPTRAISITSACSFDGQHHAVGEIIEHVDIDTAWRVVRAGKAQFADDGRLEAAMKIRLPFVKKLKSTKLIKEN